MGNLPDNFGFKKSKPIDTEQTEPEASSTPNVSLTPTADATPVVRDLCQHNPRPSAPGAGVMDRVTTQNKPTDEAGDGGDCSTEEDADEDANPTCHRSLPEEFLDWKLQDIAPGKMLEKFCISSKTHLPTSSECEEFSAVDDTDSKTP